MKRKLVTYMVIVLATILMIGCTSQKTTTEKEEVKKMMK